MVSVDGEPQSEDMDAGSGPNKQSIAGLKARGADPLSEPVVEVGSFPAMGNKLFSTGVIVSHHRHVAVCSVSSHARLLDYELNRRPRRLRRHLSHRRTYQTAS